MKGRVKTIRVDVPPNNPEYKGTFSYFFIETAWGESWHPWWGELVRFLLELERQPDGLTHRGVETEVALLTGQKRQELVELLRTAPESVVAGHQALRTALRRLPRDERDVPVRYFGPEPSEQPDG